MTPALFLVAAKTLSAANFQLVLGVLLAISEALGADPRVKANGIVSFVLLQAQNFLKAKKKEADGEHPSSHYLVVEDVQEPSTWHLRVKDADGTLNHRLMGAAWAA